MWKKTNCFAELQQLLDDLKRQDGKLLVSGQLWKVVFVTTPDMPASCELFGWIPYYRPSKTLMRCTYCGAHDTDFRKLGKKSFSLRSYSTLASLGKRAEEEGNSEGIEGMLVRSCPPLDTLTGLVAISPLTAP